MGVTKYVWRYFIKASINIAKCSICHVSYYLNCNNSNMKNHIKFQHSNAYNSIVIPETSENWPFSDIPNRKVVCNICDKIYNKTYSSTTAMKNHLKNTHKIDENTAKEPREWIFYSNHVTFNRNSTMTCKYCDQVFENNINYFNLMKHLIDAHQINVSFEVRSTRSNSSCNLPNINRNPEVATSSRNQQSPTYSMGHNTSNFLHPGRNAEYRCVAPSTSNPHQPGPSRQPDPSRQPGPSRQPSPSRQPTYSLASYNASSSLHSRPSARDILRSSHIQLMNNFKKFKNASDYMSLYLGEFDGGNSPSKDFQDIGDYDGPYTLSDISRRIENIVDKYDGPSQARRNI